MNKWFVSLLFFIYTLGLAYWQQWTATDIVWSMWLASLIGGYLTILCSIIGGALNTEGDTRPSNGGLGGSLFLLVFFSIHFIGFHFAHSQAMWEFFPLSQEQADFPRLIVLCLQHYWAFILVVLVSIWPMLRKNWQTKTDLRFEEPYKAVIRNHIMIFVVAFASEAINQQQLLYLLMVFYFFPFTQLLQALGLRKNTSNKRTGEKS